MARSHGEVRSKHHMEASNHAEQESHGQDLGLQLGALPAELALNVVEALLTPPTIYGALSACCIEDYFVERDRLRRMVKESSQLGDSIRDYPATATDQSSCTITFLWERRISRWTTPLEISRTYEPGGTSPRAILMKRAPRGSAAPPFLMNVRPIRGDDLNRFQNRKSMELCIDDDLSLLSDYLLAQAGILRIHDKTSSLMEVDVTLVLRESGFFSAHFGRQQLPCIQACCSHRQYPEGLRAEFEKLFLNFAPGTLGRWAFPSFHTINLNIIVVGQPQLFRVTWKYTPWSLMTDTPPISIHQSGQKHSNRALIFRCAARHRKAQLCWAPKLPTLLALAPMVLNGIISESLCYVVSAIVQQGLISWSREVLSSMPYAARLIAAILHMLGLEAAMVELTTRILRRILPDLVRPPRTALLTATGGGPGSTAVADSEDQVQDTGLIDKIKNMRPRLSGLAAEELEHWVWKHMVALLVVLHLVGTIVRWKSFQWGEL